MKKANVVLSFAILSAAFLAVVALRAQEPPRFTSIDFPEAVTTTAFGMNSEGDVVGSYKDAAGKRHGFLLRGGNFTSIDFPGAIATDARGINPDGDIVGSYTNSPGGHQTSMGIF